MVIAVQERGIPQTCHTKNTHVMRNMYIDLVCESGVENWQMVPRLNVAMQEKTHAKKIVVRL